MFMSTHVDKGQSNTFYLSSLVSTHVDNVRKINLSLKYALNVDCLYGYILIRELYTKKTENFLKIYKVMSKEIKNWEEHSPSVHLW